MRHLIAVCGPTASGKSAVAVRLAQKIAGEIISVDSLQVYRELTIGSAKVGNTERSAVPHHMIDAVSLDDPLDAARYALRAREYVADLRRRGSPVILVGGSNLYLKALCEGLAAMPGRSEAVRAECEPLATETLYARLKQLDPERARQLNQNDRVRIVRAIEVVQQGDVEMSVAHRAHAFASQRENTIFLVLCWKRSELVQRIHVRSVAMVADGLMSETQGLVEAGFEKHPALDAIGYREAMQALRGELSSEGVAEAIEIRTRRFARQQMIFWRNEPGKRGWLARPNSTEPAVELSDDMPIIAGRPAKPLRVLRFSIEDLVSQLSTTPSAESQVWYLEASRLLQ